MARAVPDPIEADYPDVEDGARGVRFIEAVLASARSNQKWTPASLVLTALFALAVLMSY
jgi:hypothetical protein